MKVMVLRNILVVTVLFHSLGSVVLAQGTTGRILGIVYDQSQAILPGVTITATSQETGQQRQTLSDDQGRYAIAQVRVGRYTVEAELPGFQRSVREITLTLQADPVIDFSLTVGAVDTEIVITGEAPLVETSSASLKGLVDQQQIQDLPLNGRSFTDLVALQTGVSLNYNQLALDNAATAKFSINGARSVQSSYQLDGTELRNHWGSTPGSTAGTMLGVDTVQEFSVITTVAAAEYGNFAGGVINAVTRSGTNEFHGTLFEFHRNQALDARNFFDPGDSPPDFVRNQYGFTMGGPVIPDTLFFFGSFEALNESLSTTRVSTVPSMASRAGTFVDELGGNVTPSPVTQPILNAYPVPNGTGACKGPGGIICDFLWTNPGVTDEYFYLMKVDWQVTELDSIGARYLLDDSERSDFQDSHGLGRTPSQSRNQYLMLDWNRIFSTSMVNEARVSYNRSPVLTEVDFEGCCPEAMHYNNKLFFSGKPRYGVLSPGNGISNLGVSSVRGRDIVFNRFQYIDNLSITSGAHSVKLGINVHRLQTNTLATSFGAGTVTFSSLRDLVANNTPNNFNGILPQGIRRGMRQTKWGFYIQDDWRVTPTLSLNVGLRYEPYGIPTEVAGRFSTTRQASDRVMSVSDQMFTVNPSLTNLAPRAGFSWDPFGDGKTAIRGGYGVFYDLLSPVVYFRHSDVNEPFTCGIVRRSPPFPNPTQGLDPSQFRCRVESTSDTIKQALMHQYQLSIQRELLPDLMVQIDYRGSRGSNLGHLVDVNYATPRSDVNGVYPFWPADSVRANPKFTQMRDYAWDASSFYNALGITVKKRFSAGWSLQGAYTFAKSIDDASSAGVADTGGTPNGVTHSPPPLDISKFDRGLSGFDVRNRLVINGSVDLPGRDLDGAAGAVLGGWSLNAIATMANGNHASPQIFLNNRSRSQGKTPNAFDSVDRPNLIPGGNNSPVLSDGRNPNNYFDASQWELGPAGYLGNAGRNTIENPGVFTTDVSITKDVQFDEARYMEFRAEFFNIYNRANFEQVGTHYGGNVNLFTFIFRNPNASRIVATSTTSRQIQFAVKFHF